MQCRKKIYVTIIYNFLLMYCVQQSDQKWEKKETQTLHHVTSKFIDYKS